MMEIHDPELMMLKYKQENQSFKHNENKNSLSKVFEHSFFELAFRPFFIFGTTASMLSLAIWILQLNNIVILNQTGLTPTVWHIHEMIFGFAATVAVGFILTAGKTWTKQPSITGKSLVLLSVLWLSVRTAIYINTNTSIAIAIVLQMLWWFVSIVVFVSMVYRSKNKRNYLFIPLLSAMMIMNLTILLADMLSFTQLAMHLSRASILLFTILMGIMGGRVIPFFTQNGAKTDAIVSPLWIDKLLLPASITGIFVFILGFFISLPFTPAPLMLLSGGLHLIRLSFWKSTKTLPIPLLWSLHLSYLFMALGLILLGLSYFDLTFINMPFSNALHMITIGAIGLMVFAMMSRVSLGHTGRALVLNKALILAFILLILTVLIRTILPLFNIIQLAWNLSALLWISSSLIFIFIYSPILFAKRIN
ncbi:NnrS family protein [Pseudoalteromonas denitrificans]|uniref:Uncharacterized protein involved in response to NO n=1 Tax=Pseudoalteromonas denitrificans DSM 6059 TaxID=1123010 RepID=A0A1I1PJ88_9GAMM|nr:NnrS family protein [Pseudoalteromonas denitrificans]SFD09884.1 uncharacterized protein involved in response to NO [Pseudoalteromonas denitrificans DSM 6059]